MSFWLMCYVMRYIYTVSYIIDVINYFKPTNNFCCLSYYCSFNKYTFILLTHSYSVHATQHLISSICKNFATQTHVVCYKWIFKS